MQHNGNAGGRAGVNKNRRNKNINWTVDRVGWIVGSFQSGQWTAFTSWAVGDMDQSGKVTWTRPVPSAALMPIVWS